MSRYFKEKEERKFKLSEYLEMDKSGSEYYFCPEQKRTSRTKYIMEIIGDAKLDEETYKLFLKQWQCSGGRYEVRIKKETIKGIYSISQRFPFLSVDALERIWREYIYDLFEYYHLEDMLSIFLKQYGKEDETFELYLSHVDEVAERFQKKYVQEAQDLEYLKEEYGERFVLFLQDLVRYQHISIEEIKKYLPSSELIKKDEAQLQKIVESTRIFFGACDPISYQMVESLVSDIGLDYCPDHPQYVICGTNKVDATFTKQEFLESIQKEKVKKIK